MSKVWLSSDGEELLEGRKLGFQPFSSCVLTGGNHLNSSGWLTQGQRQSLSGGGGSVTKSCPILATPWTTARQAPLSMGFPGKNAGVGCHFLLQGTFPTQGSNSCFCLDSL